MTVWTKCQDFLLPLQAPLASCVYHSAFGEAAPTTNFQHWEQAGMDMLGKSGSEVGLIRETQVIQKRGIFFKFEVPIYSNKTS